MAYAGFRFAERVMQAVKGKSGIVEPTFVYLPGIEGGDAIVKETGCDYFSVPVELGPEGAKKANNIIPSANEYEKKLLEKCYTDLKGTYKSHEPDMLCYRSMLLHRSEIRADAMTLGNIEKGIDFVKNPPQK